MRGKKHKLNVMSKHNEQKSKDKCGLHEMIVHPSWSPDGPGQATNWVFSFPVTAPQFTLTMRVKKIQSLRKIITLLGTMINRGTPCDLTNNIFDHILRANARMTFMVFFLIIILVCAEGPTPGHNATAAILGDEEGGKRSILSSQQAFDPA